MIDKYYYMIEKRYLEFKNILGHIGCFLIYSSEEDIEYHIFEESDIGVRTHLHDDMLELFLNEGFIDEDIEKKCKLLRSFFVDIEKSYPELWNVLAVKKHSEWRNALELADEIKAMLYV